MKSNLAALIAYKLLADGLTGYDRVQAYKIIKKTVLPTKLKQFMIRNEEQIKKLI
jgi:hypothetical protein